MKSSLIVSGVLLSLLIVGFFSVDKRIAGMTVLNTALKLTQWPSMSADLAYGDQPWQRLDVYQPKHTSDPTPVIMFLHGGGWQWGAKEHYYFAADAFVRLGYTVVVPDYIKYPQGRFPAFIEDGALAIAWVKANIVQFGGNPDALFLSGHSAGAHTGALLAADKGYLAAVGLSPNDIRGFAGISGPYNFTPKWPQYVETFGRENFEDMKAGSHIDGDESPMLLVHSEGDTAVGQFNQQTLYEQIDGHNGVVEKILYGPDINHINIMMKLHPWFADEQVNVAKDIHRFFQTL